MWSRLQPVPQSAAGLLSACIPADIGAHRQREQAEEGQYIKKREVEKLKEAKARLQQAQAEVVCGSSIHLFDPLPLSQKGDVCRLDLRLPDCIVLTDRRKLSRRRSTSTSRQASGVADGAKAGRIWALSKIVE